MNRWWLVYRRIFASLGLNELIVSCAGYDIARKKFEGKLRLYSMYFEPFHEEDSYRRAGFPCVTLVYYVDKTMSRLSEGDSFHVRMAVTRNPKGLNVAENLCKNHKRDIFCHESLLSGIDKHPFPEQCLICLARQWKICHNVTMPWLKNMPHYDLFRTHWIW